MNVNQESLSKKVAVGSADLPSAAKPAALERNKPLSTSSSHPITVEGCDTLVKLWRKKCLERGDKIAHREKQLGIWQSYSWDEYYQRAQDIALGLMQLGCDRGDTVSILSEDNKEWLYFDMAINGIGAVANGIYTTDSASQLVYLLNDSQSRFLVVENDEQLHKFLSVRDQLPHVAKVIVLDKKGLRELDDDHILFLETLYQLGSSADDAESTFTAAIAASCPEDIRTLVYTSGTTGNPKGAMITHRNSLAQLVNTQSVLDVSPDDEQLCFLPLCHMLERLVSVDMPIYHGCRVNFAESIETVFDNLCEISPDTFTAVPRFWEKIYASVTNLRADAGGFSQWSLDRAVACGRQYHQQKGSGLGVAIKYRFWDLLVLSNLRKLIGMNNIRRALTGAAPISPELLQWYQAIGITIYEGYGMTESAGVISVNTRDSARIGSVGKPIPNTQVRIADNGEILCKADTLFSGYLNLPEKTAEDLRDGWLHTGDVGELREGYLYITGRIKDIIITAGGKNITPAAIESQLKFSQYIADAVVIGNQRKYLTCLIMIDQENVEKYAQDHQVAFSDFKSLCHTPEVTALIEKVVNEVNTQFATVEQIKYFRLIDVLLSAEDEELTATMKLKRSFVEQKHHTLIDSMYQ